MPQMFPAFYSVVFLLTLFPLFMLLVSTFWACDLNVSRCLLPISEGGGKCDFKLNW